MFFNEYSPLGFATPSPSSLPLAHCASTQTMKNFSPRPRSIREWNIKMCNRSASLCCCCCHHFCRFRIIFRQQECWGLLGKSWTMAVYSNWNSSTSFHDKNWDSCKVILHNCWDGDELEVMKPVLVISSKHWRKARKVDTSVKCVQSTALDSRWQVFNNLSTPQTTLLWL